MGVVTGGVVGTAFHGGTITQPLTINSTGGAGVNALDVEAPHTRFYIDGDGSANLESDDTIAFNVAGTGVNQHATVSVFGTDNLHNVNVGSQFGIGISYGVGEVFQASHAGVILSLNAAPADGALNAGDCALWFDQTNGAAKLMVKAKSANGTVVTGSVTLA